MLTPAFWSGVFLFVGWLTIQLDTKSPPKVYINARKLNEQIKEAKCAMPKTNLLLIHLLLSNSKPHTVPFNFVFFFFSFVLLLFLHTVVWSSHVLNIHSNHTADQPLTKQFTNREATKIKTKQQLIFINCPVDHKSNLKTPKHFSEQQIQSEQAIFLPFQMYF